MSASKVWMSIATLTAIVLLWHGWSIADGQVLDDYWHQRGLRTHGWSLPELLKTLTIAPADFIHHWWQDRDVRFEYARPFFILVMKATYLFVGQGDPWALHALSIALHLGVVLLTWRLALRLTGCSGWALAGGALMAVYPHAAVTVAWPSSQNCVLSTFLMLAALHVYLADAFRQPREGDEPARPPASGRLAAVWLLWVAAIFTKENALVLPGILLALDLSLRRAEVLARLGYYVICASTVVSFLMWRSAALQTPLPDVYAQLPGNDLAGYAPWAAAKLVHYLASAAWVAPMMIGPSGRIDPWRDTPTDYIGMTVLVLVLYGGYMAWTRRVPGAWVAPLWVLLAVLPVIPVMATPHSGYQCGPGVACGAALAGCLAGRRRDLAAHLAGTVVVLMLIGMPILSMFGRWQWTGIAAAERLVPAWIAVAPPEPSVKHIFLINMPFANIYLRPALERQLGLPLDDVRISVLTYSPDPVVHEQRTILRWLDNDRFSMETLPGDKPYFARLLGRFLIDGFRTDGLPAVGNILPGGEFSAWINEHAEHERGIRKLTFTFRRGLNDPSYAFYLVTPEAGAARLRFPSAIQRASHTEFVGRIEQRPDQIESAAQMLRNGKAGVMDSLLTALGGDDPALAGLARGAVRQVGGFVARATAAPVQALFDQADWDQQALREIRDWWQRGVDDRLLAETWRVRGNFYSLLELREEVPHATEWAARVVRSDLYLTGPPFDGPQLKSASQP